MAKKTGWASKLSALLSRQALEVYSCLLEEAAKDYDKVTIALMKTYNHTEDDYCRKCKASKQKLTKVWSSLLNDWTDTCYGS